MALSLIATLRFVTLLDNDSFQMTQFVVLIAALVCRCKSGIYRDDSEASIRSLVDSRIRGEKNFKFEQFS
jgi:hypothetical protein